MLSLESALSDVSSALGLQVAQEDCRDSPSSVQSRILASIRALHGRIQELEHDALTSLYRPEVGLPLTYRLPRDLPLGWLVFVDVDNVKRTHNAISLSEGSRALRLVSQAIDACKRARDIGTRWGGDEFMIALHPGTEEMSRNGVPLCRLFIRRLEQAIAALNEEAWPLPPVSVTCDYISYTPPASTDTALMGARLTELHERIDQVFQRISAQKSRKRTEAAQPVAL